MWQARVGCHRLQGRQRPAEAADHPQGVVHCVLLCKEPFTAEDAVFLCDPVFCAAARVIEELPFLQASGS